MVAHSGIHINRLYREKLYNHLWLHIDYITFGYDRLPLIYGVISKTYDRPPSHKFYL